MALLEVGSGAPRAPRKGRDDRGVVSVGGRPLEGTEPERRTYRYAEEELDWWYQRGDSALGAHAAAIESGGGGVWDDVTIHRKHMARRTWSHRAEVQRAVLIGGTVGQLSPDHRALVALVYTPRRWSVLRSGLKQGGNPGEPDVFVDETAPDKLRDLTRRAGRPGCLAALCVMTKAAARAWAAREVARKREARAPAHHEVLAFLRDEAGGKGPRRLFLGIVGEAETILEPALVAYDALRTARVERVAAEKAARTARINAELARLRAGEGP